MDGHRSDQNADKGREGVKNPENFADVLYEWSLKINNLNLGIIGRPRSVLRMKRDILALEFTRFLA